ncbi:MAG: hypothetical protein ACD_83C00080G0002 [uncultured bacterium]|nr:MAG: hypothetical protein ACD_83C00080G0002 [uncultured bacterium]
MKKHLERLVKSHAIDYVVIVVLLAAFMLSVILFRFSYISIKVISIFMATAYVTWGVTHHTKRGHLDKKILLEYSGIALLGLVVVFSIIN